MMNLSIHSRANLTGLSSLELEFFYLRFTYTKVVDPGIFYEFQVKLLPDSNKIRGSSS
jgi:hypothetical protein